MNKYAVPILCTIPHTSKMPRPCTLDLSCTSSTGSLRNKHTTIYYIVRILLKSGLGMEASY